MTVPASIAAPPCARRQLFAVLGIAMIALLPLVALLLPSAAPSAAPSQRLIVLLPEAAVTLPQAAALLDAAEARPLGQGAWSRLWLVSSSLPDAATRLYDAGAHLVLAGDGLLAGCLAFRSLPSARKAT